MVPTKRRERATVSDIHNKIFVLIFFNTRTPFLFIQCSIYDHAIGNRGKETRTVTRKKCRATVRTER